MTKTMIYVMENAKTFLYNSETGVVYCDIRKISGSAGKDVDGMYLYPDGKLEIVTKDNVHYGYAIMDENGVIHDNSNRTTFTVI